MSPSQVDPILTSIAREQIPDCYVRIHIDGDGGRELSLHAGSYNASRVVPATRLRNFDVLRHTLDKLVRGYARRREVKATLDECADTLRGSWCTPRDYETPGGEAA